YHGRHGDARVAQGERKIAVCQWSYQVHRKQVAVPSLRNGNEHDRSRADIEDHELLNRGRRHVEIVRLLVLPDRSGLEHGVPWPLRPRQAAMVRFDDAKKTDLRTPGISPRHPAYLKRSDRFAGCCIDKLK